MDDSTGAIASERSGASVRTPARLRSWPREAFRDADRRRARVGTLIGLSMALFTFGAAAWDGPDKAFHKPWMASSSAAECHPERRSCAGQDTTVFFMTHEEEHPTYVVDLGVATKVHEVDVTNRLDAAQAAAVPLVVETSLDGVTYQPQVIRERAFSRLRARFPAVTARYVRLRVDKRTVLHLEAVKVR